ncbi:DNA_polymerase [Hexamita inflata]|uniref:DNA-directed DNA polymerase n=1 Tax=Hexamita inflata TaxID=28002 RepID=A0ABP1J4M7_9EUKA
MELVHKGKNYEDNLTGSDREILQTYLHATKVEIITPNEQKAAQNQKRKGAYFNYINITGLDLSKYQIGNDEKEHLNLSETQCFIYSLMQSGCYEESQIEYIRSQMNQDNIQFSLSSIKKLKGLGPIHITYYEDGKKDQIANINNSSASKNSNSKCEDEIADVPLVNIGCYKNHYFINDDCLPISKVWITNFKEHNRYSKFMENTNLKQIRKTTNSYCYSFYKQEQNIGISAGTMITTMMESGLFQEIENPNIYNQNEDKPISAPIDCQPFQKFPQNSSALKQHTEETLQIREDNKDKQTEIVQVGKQLIVYTDFESFTKDENDNNIVHKPFLLCWTVDGETVYSGKTIFSLINYIEDMMIQEGYSKFLVLYHNLSYDASFILQQQITIRDILKPDNQIIQFTVQRNHHLSIVFRDSMRLTGNDVSVSKMPSMFFTKEMQSKIYKEIFPYTYYTMNRYCNKIGSITEASKHIGKNTKEEFIFSIKNAQAYVDEDTFDLQKYALYYCQQDVRVLCKSMQLFEKMIKEQFNLELFKYVSISSLSLEDGVRMFTNDFDIERSYFYDNISLQDLITFQHIEYEIISGVRFDGRNYTIEDVIFDMFTKRQQFKKQGNPVQIIYKLMLNSSYGKTIEAVHNTEDVILNQKDYVDYIYKNKDFIKDITQIGDKYIVNIRSEVVDQTAYTYIGVLILSVSKRIMNEVKVLWSNLMKKLI